MRDSPRQDIRKGMCVRSSDGEETGTVTEVDVTVKGVGPENGVLVVGQHGPGVEGCATRRARLAPL
jgi:hypothetical protein